MKKQLDDIMIIPNNICAVIVAYGKTWVPVGTTYGVPIGKNDRKGNPIHVGDVLEFDEKEFGEKCIFTIELNNGEIGHDGNASDLSEWCEIITPWNENNELQHDWIEQLRIANEKSDEAPKS